MNIMEKPAIDKITVHVGTGESGERLTNAEKIIQTITGQKPVRSIAKKTLPAFNIKKREPIGCKVTLRGKNAENFLRQAFTIIEKKLSQAQFDSTGNFSFGIAEHTDFKGMKYDPAIGIFGMDVTVALKRPGYRIARRRIGRHNVPANHKLTVEDAVSFVKETYGVEVN